MMTLASVDDYLSQAGALDKALLPLGFMLVFCAHHRLLSADFMQQHADQMSAVRLQEGPVTALFAVHGGSLYETDFNPQGVKFLRGYLPRLAGDFASVFGANCYDIKDDWSNYQQMADVLVRRLMGPPKRPSAWAGIKERVIALWR